MLTRREIERCDVPNARRISLTAAIIYEGGRATARRISIYKSGKYTVERPLHLGAALAGRLDDLDTALSAFGLPLGIAIGRIGDVINGEHYGPATNFFLGVDWCFKKLERFRFTPLRRFAVRRALKWMRERYADSDGYEKDKPRYVHTLNGSGLALPRTQRAVLDHRAEVQAPPLLGGHPPPGGCWPHADQHP